MSAASDMGLTMARGTVSAAVVDLGKKLVAELGLEDTVDTLGRWMAHYVAELIADVEAAGSVERPAKEDRCAAAILELWRHRHDGPDGRGHFETEALLRAIESLDPEAPRHRYFARGRESAEGEDEVRSWLRLADGIDATARMLVVHCLVAAAAEAGDKSREWIAMAESAGIEDDAPALVLRFVNEQHDLIKEVAPDEADREKLRDRLERLKTFVKLAKIMQNDLTKQFGAIADSESKSAKPGKPAKRDKPKKPRKSGKSRGPRGSANRGRKGSLS